MPYRVGGDHYIKAGGLPSRVSYSLVFRSPQRKKARKTGPVQVLVRKRGFEPPRDSSRQPLAYSSGAGVEGGRVFQAASRSQRGARTHSVTTDSMRITTAGA